MFAAVFLVIMSKPLAQKLACNVDLDEYQSTKFCCLEDLCIGKQLHMVEKTLLTHNAVVDQWESELLPVRWLWRDDFYVES